MKWVLIVGAALVLLVVLIALIGMMLPQNHVASVRRRHNAPPGDVWALLLNIGEFPSWRTDIQSVERLPSSEGKLRWKEKSRQGAITMEVDQAVPQQRLVTRIADKGLPFGGTWTFELTPDGAGTILDITERGEIYNPIFRFVARFVVGYTSTMEKYQDALAARLQSKTAAAP